MPPRSPDLSPEYFTWLVEGRSTNQRSTLELYRIIAARERDLNGNVELQEAAQDLTGIAFSLWRAVFLSDTSGEFDDQLADIKKFLVSLISDNTVLYVTDKNSRNWSFHYYLDNVLHRLAKLAAGDLALVDAKSLSEPMETDKDQWQHAQSILGMAIARFESASSK